jgi:hypothetical protein
MEQNYWNPQNLREHNEPAQKFWRDDIVRFGVFGDDGCGGRGFRDGEVVERAGDCHSDPGKEDALKGKEGFEFLTEKNRVFGQVLAIENLCNQEEKEEKKWLLKTCENLLID